MSLPGAGEPPRALRTTRSMPGAAPPRRNITPGDPRGPDSPARCVGGACSPRSSLIPWHCPSNLAHVYQALARPAFLYHGGTLRKHPAGRARPGGPGAPSGSAGGFRPRQRKCLLNTGHQMDARPGRKRGWGLAGRSFSEMQLGSDLGTKGNVGAHSLAGTTARRQDRTAHGRHTLTHRACECSQSGRDHSEGRTGPTNGSLCSEEASPKKR